MTTLKLYTALASVLYDCRVEQQGLCPSQVNESISHWVENWFGKDATYKGEFHSDGHYMYSFTEPMSHLLNSMSAGIVYLPNNEKVYIYTLD